MTVSFFIPGEPVALARHRYTIAKGKIHNYNAPKNADYKALVSMIANREMNGSSPLEKAVALNITVNRLVPQSWSKKKQKMALAGEVKPTTRPDIDNYLKSVLDGCTGIIFKDDSQVTYVTASKVYSTTPGVSVVAFEM
jgi:Holliday junction resolvase RusA-like endonuclease